MAWSAEWIKEDRMKCFKFKTDLEKGIKLKSFIKAIRPFMSSETRFVDIFSVPDNSVLRMILQDPAWPIVPEGKREEEIVLEL